MEIRGRTEDVLDGRRAMLPDHARHARFAPMVVVRRADGVLQRPAQVDIC